MDTLTFVVNVIGILSEHGQALLHVSSPQLFTFHKFQCLGQLLRIEVLILADFSQSNLIRFRGTLNQ